MSLATTPKRPSLALEFHEEDGKLYARLSIAERLQLDLVWEDCAPIRVIGYPSQLNAEAGVHRYLVRQALNNADEYQRSLDEVIGVAERQIVNQVGSLRREVRKLALLSARANAAKRIRKEIDFDTFLSTHMT